MPGSRKGIEIELEEPGTDRIAQRGDTVTILYSLSLNRGHLVHSEETATLTLGGRVMIPGLEYGIEGMRIGGRRRFRVSPHLAYGDAGVAGKIPAKAVLIFDVRLLNVENLLRPPD